MDERLDPALDRGGALEGALQRVASGHALGRGAALKRGELGAIGLAEGIRSGELLLQAEDQVLAVSEHSLQPGDLDLGLGVGKAGLLALGE